MEFKLGRNQKELKERHKLGKETIRKILRVWGVIEVDSRRGWHGKHVYPSGDPTPEQIQVRAKECRKEWVK